MVHDAQSGSRSQNPDLDWSQVRETVNLLTLSIAQIECMMKDGDKSVSELSQSFVFIADNMKELIQAGESNESSTAAALTDKAKNVHGRVNEAIVAFQFYDKLTQRLDHVKRDLLWLSRLIGDSSQLYNPESWKKLQQDICNNYTMEEERLMFEQIIRGSDLGSALEIYHHHFDKKDDGDDELGDEVELF